MCKKITRSSQSSGISPPNSLLPRKAYPYSIICSVHCRKQPKYHRSYAVACHDHGAVGPQFDQNRLMRMISFHLMFDQGMV